MALGVLIYVHAGGSRGGPSLVVSWLLGSPAALVLGFLALVLADSGVSVERLFLRLVCRFPGVFFVGLKGLCVLEQEDRPVNLRGPAAY